MNKYRVFGLNTDWGRPNCDGKYGGVGWYRLINPLEKIGADVQRGKFAINGAQSALDMKKRGDIWVTKHIDSMDLINTMIVDKEFTGAKLVLDFDDDPFNLNPDHPAYEAFVSRRPLYEAFIKGADHIICSTNAIKDVIEPLNYRITVIPNAIDPEIWKVKGKKRTDGKIRIGWFGSSSHLADMHLILPVIEELEKKYDNVEFHLVGFADTKVVEGRRFHYPPTKGYEEYPQFVADMSLDIAIAPLIDSQFNRAKSNIKWLEHSMLKTPMVLSDVSPYKESVDNYKTGYLASGTNQWVKYLSWLIESPEKRKEIGENAYQAVMKDWLIEKQLPKYEKLFKKLMPKNITVYTSLVGGYDELNFPEGDANFVAFTDRESKEWEVRKPYDKFKDDQRNSRIQKIMPHLFIDTEYSIYLDANIKLLVEPQVLIDEFLKNKDIAVFKHPGRNNIYEEADAILHWKKETQEALGEQISAYAKRNIKEKRKPFLVECGVIIRRHTPAIEKLNEKWWADYCRYSCRDQMSFPMVFPKNKVNIIQGQITNHPYLEYKNHKWKEK